jgi:hypothetical protein
MADLANEAILDGHKIHGVPARSGSTHPRLRHGGHKEHHRDVDRRVACQVATRLDELLAMGKGGNQHLRFTSRLKKIDAADLAQT